ncbi:MAG: GlcNAc-PI de-N-acetylase [Saprospiraceae bacterium]|nr:MAG: GlcNAc-PI de-N-acetylase [Saprospiraceae bacterium]
MRIFFRISLVFIFLSVSLLGFAQAPKKWTSADIHESIRKLNFLGSALYVAAHPDDENTRLIAYLSNEVKANTAYLSLTRGDGGQNLVGAEISELLGVIRTQELLAARRTDGGNQMFSRANDFGYSKHPDETLKIWNKEEVLSDVVWAIRKWQPDVIINRFNHDSAGETHGHHTSSAMLSYEAFDLANDKNAYPDQLKYVQLWQPQRLFFNTSWWFYGSQENFEKADKSKMLSMDVGVYYPIMGKSNNEIAAESRSMHKSQGFGSTGSRGTEMEYLELLKGDLPDSKSDIFAGINTTWSRVKGGEPIGKMLQSVEKNFNYGKPYESIDQLLKAYQLINKLPESYWKKVKTNEIKQVIKACMALYAEAVADDYSATPGQTIEVNLEFTNRSPVAVSLKDIHFLPLDMDTTLDQALANNQPFTLNQQLQLPANMPYTNAYWLNKKHELGMYEVEDQTLRGLPETPRQLKITYTLVIKGIPVTYEQDIVFKRNDPVDGEVYRPFEITPPVFANIAEKVYVFGNSSPKTINVLLKSGQENISGTLELCHGDKWRVEPEKYDFSLSLKGEEHSFSFKLYPPTDQDENFVVPLIKIGEQSYSQEIVSIEYDHIPTQTVFRDASSKVVHIDLQKAGDRVGYIMGAGDEIPASLTQIGYDVTLLEDRDINAKNLKNFDAVILGIRAYNTEDRLKFHQSGLLEYVKEGGTLIVQYNTNRGLKVPMDEIAPFPLKISRDRVAVEEAEIRLLEPEHRVLNWPNKITDQDFEGWVQERGLYFPNEWAEEFTAILSSNDPGETPKDGGLLVAKYGKGYYIYSGYSWFRELPAGVPGAFRLFANMISIGKEAKP